MPQPSQDQPDDGNPTAAEIFRVFRNTTMASLQGLRLLLGECADLRAISLRSTAYTAKATAMEFFPLANKIAYWNYKKRRTRWGLC
jgi:hypothetical protein